MLDSLKAHLKGRPSDEKGAASEQESHQQAPSPPPAYTPRTAETTWTFADLNLDNSAHKPTRDQCIAHLKLLEAIHGLRESITCQDGFMGLYDSVAASDPELLLKVCEKRWAVYVAKAVRRFEAWWNWDLRTITCDALERILDDDISKYQAKFSWTRDELPPLGNSLESVLERY